MQLQMTPDLKRLSDLITPKTKRTQKRTRGLQRVLGMQYCQRCGRTSLNMTNATSIRLRRR